MRRSVFTMTAIVAAGAALRFWALGAGIPYSVGVDEPELMARAVNMMRTGDFNPHFFDYPGLYIHLQLIVACLRFLAGATAGEWRSLADVSTADFYLWGRALTALLGTATVLLVYFIGMRWGTRYAALAAGLLAVMPIHVRESHYVLTDVPATFFVTLTFLLSLRAHEQPRAAAFALAGFAAGLSAATKYPAALALLLPLITAWMTPGAVPSRAIAALTVCGSFLAGFFVGAPYTLLDLPGFLNGYAHLASFYSGRKLGEAPGITYLKHLRNALHWPAFLMLAAGLLLGIVRAVRGPGRVRWTMAVVFPVVYFWFVSRQTLVFGRYLMPLIPFVCVLAAAAVVSGVSLLRRFDIPRAPRTALIVGLTVAALLPPAIQAIGFNIMITRRGTTEEAHNWIVQNVPRGSRIVVEARAVMLPETYQAEQIPRLVANSRDPGVYEKFVEQGYQYLVASSQAYGPALSAPHQHPELFKAYMLLFEQSRELVRFTPDDHRPGPEIRIFALK